MTTATKSKKWDLDFAEIESVADIDQVVTHYRLEESHSFRKSRGEWVGDCVYGDCGDNGSSFGFNIDKGVGFCHKCERKPRIIGLVSALENTSNLKEGAKKLQDITAYRDDKKPEDGPKEPLEKVVDSTIDCLDSVSGKGPGEISIGEALKRFTDGSRIGTDFLVIDKVDLAEHYQKQSG